MNFEFDYNSEIARKSRLYVQLKPSLVKSLKIFSLLLVLTGITLFLINYAIGSLILSVAIILYLPIIWYENDLKLMTPIINSSQPIKVQEIFSKDVVGRLKSINSPYDLWLGVKDTWQQRFFCAHYNIPAEVFESLSKDHQDMNNILGGMMHLSQKNNQNHITVASVLSVLLKLFPNQDQILGIVGLDEQDIETSIAWIGYNENLINSIGNVNNTGGLARDWTSGYTPTLNSMAYNMTRDIERSGHSEKHTGVHEDTVNEMVKFMSDGRQNVILVGDVGAGKTTAVYNFARNLLFDANVPKSIRFNQIFTIDASSIISMSRDANQVEMALYRIVTEANKSKNTILFFDDAVSFFSRGTGAINIENVIKPLIENNIVPVIFAMTPSEWQSVSASNQALAGLLNYLVVKEPSEEDIMRVLQDKSLITESRHNVVVTYQALKEAIDLSGRYINDIAFPGKAITLLENSVNHADGSFLTAQSIQRSIEATHGVKVQVATGIEKQDLLKLEDQIHKQMINQSRAVKVVSDALRRARSGVNNPNKPIGTFLFLGPTGVGKTELAKAVANVYFGEVSKMVRVDMNEFTQSSDISRLLDVTNSTSLLSSVGRNRFTVVLIDEIEKAHPEIVNSFLQLIDEGVMRDSNNKEVSFKDTIVIATSNAGANQIRAHIDAGEEVEQFEEGFVNKLIDEGLFSPEFINRFDETVIFRPLKLEELVQIVDLFISEVNKNLNKQKVSVILTQEAKNWLAQKGYDPRLGARPLKRMVQRTVENVVAKKLLNSNFAPGSNLTLDVADLESENIK